MIRRVFIKVVGFTDVERHALNTVFRLSGERETVYQLWAPDAPELPKMALLDGLSYEAPVEAESPQNADLKLIWVGESPPDTIWRSFQRPLAWTEVLNAMDQAFAPKQSLDFDLDFDSGSAAAPVAEAGRALIASSDPQERLYLRAKLALSHLTVADEAATAAQALELAQANQYQVALVDFGLPDLDGWESLRRLCSVPIVNLIVLKQKVSRAERARAKRAGAKAMFRRPPDPGKLQELLDSCRRVK
jgi:CheY-like chemotaxis protein